MCQNYKKIETKKRNINVSRRNTLYLKNLTYVCMCVSWHGAQTTTDDLSTTLRKIINMERKEEEGGIKGKQR